MATRCCLRIGRKQAVRGLGENTEGNTEGPDSKSRKKSELWTPGAAFFGERSLLHQVASRASDLRKRFRLRTGGELAENRLSGSLRSHR